ncbi:MAG: NAD-dependent succinate-semialdehyde dehydrogenase [Proteobacteria bacterium]|nr:NAD-dependent succinate-semialdehyde dehydrogenase [Pseudomonadota bacterium]
MSCQTELLAEMADKGVFKEQAFINNQWVNSASGETLAVTNPANGETLARLPDLGAAETQVAIEAAKKAFQNWRSLLPQERCVIIECWHDLINEHKQDLATLMVLEQGKSLQDARDEIDYANGFVKWFAEEAKRIEGTTFASHKADKQMLSIRQPIGVVALVTPWNFPIAMLTRKAAAALAVGCPVVCYQSMETPLCALALAALAEQAGFPAGVFQVLTGNSRVIVKEFCESETIRALSFTGSTEVGKILLEQCAPTVKKCSMELGGHAPFIGYPDVPLEDLVQAVIEAKFQTSGQDCLAANRIYIHQGIYEAFVQAFTKAVSQLKVGDGFEAGVQICPLQNSGQVAKSQAHTDDAVAKGARLMIGGKQPERGGNFFEPTVLADITDDMRITYEETFGPVAAVMPFDDEDDVLKRANDTQYGLAAYIWTRDIGRIWRFSNTLEYGMIGVNTVSMTGYPIPFGGVKQSGLGREGSRFGIDEYSELKYICMGELNK